MARSSGDWNDPLCTDGTDVDTIPSSRHSGLSFLIEKKVDAGSAQKKDAEIQTDKLTHGEMIILQFRNGEGSRFKMNGGLGQLKDIVSSQISTSLVAEFDNWFLFVKGNIRDSSSVSFFLAMRYATDIIPRNDIENYIMINSPLTWTILKGTIKPPKAARWNRNVTVAPEDVLFIIKNRKAIKVHITYQTKVLKYPDVVNMINGYF